MVTRSGSCPPGSPAAAGLGASPIGYYIDCVPSPLLVRFLIQAYGHHDEDDALMEYLLNRVGNNYVSALADGATFTYENWRGRKAGDAGPRSGWSAATGC